MRTLDLSNLASGCAIGDFTSVSKAEMDDVRSMCTSGPLGEAGTQAKERHKKTPETRVGSCRQLPEGLPVFGGLLSRLPPQVNSPVVYWSGAHGATNLDVPKGRWVVRVDVLFVGVLH